MIDKVFLVLSGMVSEDVFADVEAGVLLGVGTELAGEKRIVQMMDGAVLGAIVLADGLTAKIAGELVQTTPRDALIDNLSLLETVFGSQTVSLSSLTVFVAGGEVAKDVVDGEGGGERTGGSKEAGAKVLTHRLCWNPLLIFLLQGSQGVQFQDVVDHEAHECLVPLVHPRRRQHTPAHLSKAVQTLQPSERS